MDERSFHFFLAVHAMQSSAKGFIEKQAEDPSLSREGMNAVPKLLKLEAKSIFG